LPNPLRGRITQVRDNRRTAVFTTHAIDEALQIGDRIVVLTRLAKIAFDVQPRATVEG